jgi:hypothetical protein
MLGANAVVGCPPVVAWGNPFVVAEQRNFDMPELAVVRVFGACSRAFGDYPVACQYEVVEGEGVAGQVLRATRQLPSHQHRSHRCLRVQEHSDKPARCQRMVMKVD